MAAFLFRLDSLVEFSAPIASRFVDVWPRSTFYGEISWLASTGVTTGFADGTYRPNLKVTREMMAAFLYRLAGSPAFVPPSISPFYDVSTAAAFYKEIAWLGSSGITRGFPDGSFGPGAGVTREAMAAFLYRFAQSPNFSPPTRSPFSDLSTRAPLYAEVAWLASTGISQGYSDGSFAPASFVTRDVMAAFLFRFDSLGFVSP
jgi:hypothetical protein